MSRQKHLFVTLFMLMASFGLALGVGKSANTFGSFSTAEVHFEQNATDEDAEVVFEVRGGTEGLTELSVAAPDGRNVIRFNAPEASMGIRQFRFESPEPGDVEALKAAYPQGVYSFKGATQSGRKLRGEARLIHALPAPTTLVKPAAGAKGLPIEGLEVTWKPGKDAVAYILVIESGKPEMKITANLPGSVSRFAVPSGVLAPGNRYGLQIGAVTASGNVSFVEASFTTAAKM